jgi:hypothetical protein
MPEVAEPAPQMNETNRCATQAWNLMGGLDWSALGTVADLLGVEDVERWIYALVQIRDSQGAGNDDRQPG